MVGPGRPVGGRPPGRDGGAESTDETQEGAAVRVLVVVDES